MKPNFTEIIVILDRSGSMESIKKDMMGGFDTFIKEQRLVPGECKVSLYQFDTIYEPVYEGKSLQDVPPLSLVPRDGTALYDAVAKTIVATGERLNRTPERERPSKVLVMIITDGEENSSKEYSKHQNGALRVKQMIDHQQQKYSWQFVYLGVGDLVVEQARAIGIYTASSYEASAGGAKGLFAAVSNSTRAYRGSSAQMDFAIADKIPVFDEKAFDHQTAQPPVHGTLVVDPTSVPDTSTTSTPDAGVSDVGSNDLP